MHLLDHLNMAQYNFEGHIENITEGQLEFIHKVVVELGYNNSKVTFQPVGQDGDNYVASVRRITMEGENGKLTMIAKIAPTNETLRQNMNTFLLFRNEHFMYTEVLPKLVQLQKKEEVPEEDHLKFAKCYGSLAEAPNEVILLEDLSTSDFVMLDRFESLSNECVKSVLKNLAVLHSLSYQLKNIEPDTYNYFKENLIDMWGVMAAIEGVFSNFQVLEDSCLQVLDDPEHKNIVRHKMSDAIARAAKLMKFEHESKYAIIQQGDSWTNNIMFKFEDGSLKQSILIDYQLSKNTSPVSDILYTIFNCTDHETRSKHYYDWIDYYHAELEKSLSNFGLKVNFVYPREQLDADIKRYGKLMFGLCIILASVTTIQPDEARKMKEQLENVNVQEAQSNMEYAEHQAETIVRMRNKIVGLIESFTQFGLL